MQNLVIDISKRGVIPPIIVTEHDSMSRFFTLRLLNNGADYTPPENANYSVWYETNDSKGWYDTVTLPDETSRPAVVEDGNVLTVEVAEAATTSCGELAVMVTGNDGYQLTVSGIRLMSADVPGYDGAEVEDYYNVYIADMQKNAARAENAAQTAIEYGATIDVEDETLIIDHYDDAGEVETWATVSEAWAVGQRNGEDVPSTDETYHNNSKYYAGQAANSAVNAAASAETAEEAAELCFTTAIKSSASGAVASFSDGADNIPMQSLIAEITPVQSGTGDPSPTNIRPISGRTGLTVTRAGKNLITLNSAASQSTTQGVTFTPQHNNGTILINGTAENVAYKGFTYTGKYNALDATRYHGMTLTGAVVCDNEHVKGAWTYYKQDGSYVNLVSGNVKTATFTVPDEAIGFRLLIAVGEGTTLTNVEARLTLTLGTEPTYDPYLAQAYTVNWQTEAGTVYGGTLDVVSGVLTVDKYLLTCGETITPTSGNYWYGANPNRWQVVLPVNLVPSNDTMAQSICNTFAYWGGGFTGWPDGTFRFSGIQSDGTRFLQFKWADQPTTVEDLKAFLAENPLHFVIPFATPQTYQLTPTEVRTILGGNTIYTDAGDVSVEYIADTKLYIDNKIAELQALVLEN